MFALKGALRDIDGLGAIVNPGLAATETLVPVCMGATDVKPGLAATDVLFDFGTGPTFKPGLAALDALPKGHRPPLFIVRLVRLRVPRLLFLRPISNIY